MKCNRHQGSVLCDSVAEVAITVLNPASGGGGISRCIKACYFKIGIRNILFTTQEGFKATAIMYEYEL